MHPHQAGVAVLLGREAGMRKCEEADHEALHVLCSWDEKFSGFQSSEITENWKDPFSALGWLQAVPIAVLYAIPI